MSDERGFEEIRGWMWSVLVVVYRRIISLITFGLCRSLWSLKRVSTLGPLTSISTDVFLIVKQRSSNSQEYSSKQILIRLNAFFIFYTVNAFKEPQEPGNRQLNTETYFCLKLDMKYF